MLKRTIFWLNEPLTPGLTAGDLRDEINGLAKLRGALDARDNRLAVALEAVVGGRDAVEVVRESTGCSRREARRRAERAQALKDMPNTAGALSEGRITTEHADALVRAGKDTDPAAVDADTQLLDQVADEPADKAGRLTDEWARRRQSPEDLEAAHRRARAKRRVDFFPTEDKMLRASITGDNTTMAMIQATVLDIAQRMHTNEGGRDNPKHDRTWAQYRYDAVLVALGIEPFPPPRTHHGRTTNGSGAAGGSASATAGDARRGSGGSRRPDGQGPRHGRTSNGHPRKAGNHPAPKDVAASLWNADNFVNEPDSGGNGLSLPGITGDALTGDLHEPQDMTTSEADVFSETDGSPWDDGLHGSTGRGCVCGGGKLSQRNQIVIVAQLDDLAGKGNGTLGGLIPGTGPISRSELERLACNADLQGLIFSGSGEPLWLGRRRRTASAAQHKALVARDRGCVLCGANPHHCHAHHILPWQNDGPTDIDNLALVCHQDHSKIHDRQLRLKRHPDGTWTTTHDPTMVKAHDTS